MTFEELGFLIKEMTPEQLKSSVSFSDGDPEEYYPVNSLGKTGPEDDVLDGCSLFLSSVNLEEDC